MSAPIALRRVRWHSEGVHIYFIVLLVLCTGYTLIGCDSESSSGTVVIVPDDARVPADPADGSADGGSTNGMCPSIGDGICDEPSRCPLGSDDADCVAACEDSSTLAFHAAACHHRNLLPPAHGRTSGTPVTRTPQWIDETFPAKDDQGRTVPRHLRLFIPPGLPDQPVPLVLMLPGNRVSHYNLPDYTHLDSTAVANGFIVGYVEQPWRSRTFSWSWYTDWDWANNADENPDIRFLSSLIDYLIESRPIDPQRVYVAGHSRGAAMSVIAALEMPDRIAGAIPQSGFVEFGYFDRLRAWTGDRKPAFFFMHGALDDDVCVDCTPGGRCGVQPLRQCGQVASSDAIVDALTTMGWTEDTLRYARPDRVAHRWQPWLNQAWWDFVSTHRVGESP